MRRIALFIVLTLFVSPIVSAETQPLTAPVVSGISNPAATLSEANLRAQKLWVEEIIGVVEIKTKDQADFKAILKKTSVSVGDTIRTTEGACVLVLQNNARVTIAPNTTLVINEATMSSADRTRTTLLQLDAGKLKARVDKFSNGSKFEVRTPTAVAAVRGTLFYLSAGTQIDQIFTELYVDNGNVFFENIFSNFHFLLPYGNGSTAFGDGSLLAPRQLTQEEQDEFRKNWEDAIKNLLKKGGVEEVSTATDPVDDSTDDNDQENGDSETLTERNAEQLTDLFTDAAENIAKIEGILGDAFDAKTALINLDINPDLDFLKRKAIGAEEALDQNNNLPQGQGPNDPALNPWTYELVLFDNNGALPGDFNGDGSVDTDDYNTWREGFGTTYNAADYAIWRKFFGESGGSIVKDKAGDLGIVDEAAQDQVDDLEEEFDLFDQTLVDTTATIQALIDQLSAILTAANLNPNNTNLLQQAQDLIDDINAIDLTSLIAQQQAALDHYNQALVDLETRRENERNVMRNEIGRLADALDFERGLAQIEKNSDAATGKVFTDVHGNRVRVDQYIFQDRPQEVRVMSLTMRTTGNFQGVSSFVFGVDFNQAIDRPLRELPWGDYLNVVTRDELDNVVENNLPGYFEEFIVYSDQGENAPSLYPVRFFAEFGNVAANTGYDYSDRVRFENWFTSPFNVQNGNIESEGVDNTNLWIQARWAPVLVIVDPAGNGSSDWSVAFVNNLPFTPQTGNFADIFNNDFAGNNEGGESYDATQNPNNFWEGYRPAGFTLDTDYCHTLSGMFIPINDNGTVIDAPGFQLQGIRDFISPNPNVNGGNYNLEVILDFRQNDGGEFGTKGFVSSGHDFRIDTIITPEIFGEYGASNENPLFPRLGLDDDDEVILD